VLQTILVSDIGNYLFVANKCAWQMPLLMLLERMLDYKTDARLQNISLLPFKFDLKLGSQILLRS
jgi:hypothetical protein